jgi:hypothetical protein
MFVYDAARLAALAANAPIVPVPWAERDDAFREQFRDVIERQCGPMRSSSPEELHGSWTQAYIDMGWTYSEKHDPNAKTHPDLVPYAQLEHREQEKDAVFVALCEIARQWIYDHDCEECEHEKDRPFRSSAACVCNRCACCSNFKRKAEHA